MIKVRVRAWKINQTI